MSVPAPLYSNSRALLALSRGQMPPLSAMFSALASCTRQPITRRCLGQCRCRGRKSKMCSVLISGSHKVDDDCLCRPKPGNIGGTKVWQRGGICHPSSGGEAATDVGTSACCDCTGEAIVCAGRVKSSQQWETTAPASLAHIWGVFQRWAWSNAGTKAPLE